MNRYLWKRIRKDVLGWICEIRGHKWIANWDDPLYEKVKSTPAGFCQEPFRPSLVYRHLLRKVSYNGPPKMDLSWETVYSLQCSRCLTYNKYGRSDSSW